MFSYSLYQESQVKIIGLTGKCFNELKEEAGVKGVGKDTVALMIQKILQPETQVHILPLAQKLKEIVLKIFNLPKSIDASQVSKMADLPQYPGWSFRKLLEVVGTNVIRNGLAKCADGNGNNEFNPKKFNRADQWVRAAEYEIKNLQLTPRAKFMAQLFDLNHYELHELGMHEKIDRLGFDKLDLLRIIDTLWKENNLPDLKEGVEKPIVIIIPDVRFQNEVEFIQRMDGLLICVARTVVAAKSTGAISDQHLKNVKYDAVIVNDGTMGQLEMCISKFIAKFIAKLLTK